MGYVVNRPTSDNGFSNGLLDDMRAGYNPSPADVHPKTHWRSLGYGQFWRARE